MKKRTGDDWFPFWIDKWLLGSTRDELTIEQCAVWVDFLALSYKDEGYIRANKGIPYPIKRLAGLLNRPVKLIQATIDRCLEPKINKLRCESDGTLYVVSHPEYELSKRHKRRLKQEEDVRQNGHDGRKKDTRRTKADEKSRGEKNRGEKSRGEKKESISFIEERKIEQELKTVKGLGPTKRGMIRAYLKKLAIEFPDVDVVYEIKKKVAWWLDHPLTKRSNIHLQLRNWFIISQKGFDEAKKQHRVGKDYGPKKTKYPPAFLNSVYKALQKQGKNNAKYSRMIHDIDYYQARQLAKKYKDSPEKFIKFLEEK